MADSRRPRAAPSSRRSSATLADRLARETRLAPRVAATIAADVADALAALHAAGSVHRDVRPTRIIVSDGNAAELLDADRDPSATVAPSPASEDRLVFGSLAYMAPEQLAGGRADQRGDVYALGAVLYQMLSGKPPFAATTPIGMVREQRLAPARVIGVPRPVMDVTLAALSHDPHARPTAEALGDALRKSLARGMQRDAPMLIATVPDAAGRSARRRAIDGRRAAAGLAAVALAALLGVAVLATQSLLRFEAPPASPSAGQLAEPATAAPTLPSLPPTAAPTATPATGDGERDEERDLPTQRGAENDRRGNEGGGNGRGNGNGGDNGRGNGNGGDNGNRGNGNRGDSNGGDNGNRGNGNGGDNGSRGNGNRGDR